MRDRPGDVAPLAAAGALTDLPASRRVLGSERVFDGLIWDVVREEVDLGDAGVVRREYVRHPGAVAVLAHDEDERVLLVRQYRHPVRMELWELPAGLLDGAGLVTRRRSRQGTLPAGCRPVRGQAAGRC